MNASSVREDAYRFLREHFSQLVALMIPISIVWLGVSYLVSLSIGEWTQSVVTGAIDIVAYALMDGVVIVYVRQALSGGDAGVRQVYAEAIRYWPRLSWLMVVRVLAIIAGLILLVVPGVIVAVRFALAEQVLILRDSDVNAAIDSSIELTKPFFGLVLGSLGVLLVVTSVITAGVDYASAVVSEYLALLLFPICAAFMSVTTIAAYRIYSLIGESSGA